jgi:hypothetical protein
MRRVKAHPQPYSSYTAQDIIGRQPEKNDRYLPGGQRKRHP